VVLCQLIVKQTICILCLAMLSNKDFSKLLSTPSSGGTGGKVRFDLKQINQWDKEIKAKTKSKSSSFGKALVKEDEGKNDKLEGPVYRDRAQERRTDANPDYDPESIEAVIRLDAEKTKYLGGDVDHTHLVKGLDYTLLKKIRNDVEHQAKVILPDVKPDQEAYTDITTLTDVGSRLQSLLLSSRESSDNAGVTTSASILKPQADNLFARIAFEFDVDAESDAELPTTVARSKQESTTAEDLLTFLPSLLLLEKIGQSLANAKSTNKQKRRRREAEPFADAAEPPKPAISRIVDTVGDIFEDTGKYIPAGMEMQKTDVSQLKIEGEQRPKASSIGHGYFGVDSRADTEDGEREGDILAPVKALVRAAAEKERVLAHREAESHGGWDRDVSDGRVHRDVIGALDTAAAKRGDALGVGNYDVYPESADYEMYDSDGEEAAPKSKGAGGTGDASGKEKKSAGDKKVAPVRPKESGTDGGMNRAARRAASRGEDVDGSVNKKRQKP